MNGPPMPKEGPVSSARGSPAMPLTWKSESSQAAHFTTPCGDASPGSSP